MDRPTLGTASVIRANSRSLPLVDNTVDLVVTSPPYFALRSYQDGGEHYAGQIGDEPTPAEFVDSLLEVTRECMRVLKPSGSLFVNLGDKYAGSSNGTLGHRAASRDRSARPSGGNTTGVATKSLIGIPWRYALACIDDLGLILRAEVIWSKPNGLPESVTDRVRRSHEQWFHFTLQPRYFSAVDEIREEYDAKTAQRYAAGYGTKRKLTDAQLSKNTDYYVDDLTTNPLGKLPGSVWTIPTEPLKVPDHLGIDHFAAFPTEWPKRIIQGWSPSGVCVECGEGRRPVARKSYAPGPNNPTGQALGNTHKRSDSNPKGTTLQMRVTTEIVGETCACAMDTAFTSAPTRATNQTATALGGTQQGSATAPARTTLPPTRPAVVLDPFGGTGTTAMVARALGRTGISVDMSADYCRLATWRTGDRNQLAKVLGIEKVEQHDADQLDLFGGAA